MERLVALALERNPQVSAARAAVLQAEAGRRGAYGFFDPRATSAAGWADGTPTVPGVAGEGGIADNADSFQAGVEKPLSPGFYLGVGGAERHLRDPVADIDELNQTVGGVQIRIPLLKDRGFKQWKEEYAGLQAGYEEYAGRFLTACQDVQRTVEERYILYLWAIANQDIAEAATARAQRLLKDAQDLVSLQVVPQYQLYPARLEVATSREAETNACATVGTSRRQIQEVVGESPMEASTQHIDIVALAESIRMPDLKADAIPPERRGIYVEKKAQLAGQAASLRLAEDSERSDLSFQTAYTWQGEDPSNLIGTERILTDPHSGGEALLVWKRPLGVRQERAKIEAAKARMSELQEELKATEWQMAAERDVAAENFRSARQRLALMTDAVLNARDALAAEEERFRLGEGTSRQVLDAQKDLTAIVQRQNDIAAELLQARSGYLHAVGLMGWDVSANRGRQK